MIESLCTPNERNNKLTIADNKLLSHLFIFDGTQIANPNHKDRAQFNYIEWKCEWVELSLCYGEIDIFSFDPFFRVVSSKLCIFRRLYIISLERFKELFHFQSFFPFKVHIFQWIHTFFRSVCATFFLWWWTCLSTDSKCYSTITFTKHNLLTQRLVIYYGCWKSSWKFSHLQWFRQFVEWQC